MSRTVLKVIDFDEPDEEVINDAVEVLTSGFIAVAPTETRYGLLANARETGAVDKLYSVKGRPKEMPSAVFVKDIQGITQYGEMNDSARKLAEKFLPGKLTLVIKAACDLPSPIVKNGKIGIRISSAPFIKQLMAQVDFPITATSANLSGDSESEDANEIARQFGSKIQLYVEAGKLTGPVSTVIDCVSQPCEILREGAISEEDIKKALI